MRKVILFGCSLGVAIGVAGCRSSEMETQSQTYSSNASKEIPSPRKDGPSFDSPPNIVSREDSGSVEGKRNPAPH